MRDIGSRRRWRQGNNLAHEDSRTLSYPECPFAKEKQRVQGKETRSRYGTRDIDEPKGVLLFAEIVCLVCHPRSESTARELN